MRPKTDLIDAPIGGDFKHGTRYLLFLRRRGLLHLDQSAEPHWEYVGPEHTDPSHATAEAISHLRNPANLGAMIVAVRTSETVVNRWVMGVIRPDATRSEDGGSRP